MYVRSLLGSNHNPKMIKPIFQLECIGSYIDRDSKNFRHLPNIDRKSKNISGISTCLNNLSDTYLSKFIKFINITIKKQIFSDDR